MKILAIADEESKYLWDYFEKSKLEGIDLIISCGDLDRGIFPFLQRLLRLPFCMYMEIMMTNMNGSHRTDASALTIKFMFMRVSASWDSAVP